MEFFLWNSFVFMELPESEFYINIGIRLYPKPTETIEKSLMKREKIGRYRVFFNTKERIYTTNCLLIR